MFVGLGLLLVSYALFTVAASNVLHIDNQHQALATSPIPQMLLGKAILGQVGIWIMLAATLLTAVMTFNGGFATASRFMYAAAREDTLPPVFARISIDSAVPYVTVVVLAGASAVIAILIFLTGQFQLLILVGSVLEALIYTVAGLCVLQLRRRQPNAERSFRIRGGLIIPVATIIIFGLLGILASLGAGTVGVFPGVPLVLTLFVFALSTLYVLLIVPRLRKNAAAKRAATTRRRPGRETRKPEVSQG